MFENEKRKKELSKNENLMKKGVMEDSWFLSPKEFRIELKGQNNEKERAMHACDNKV